MNKQHFLNRFILQQTNPAVFEANGLPTFKENTTLKKAAVLMPLIQRNSGLHMIFTQRALHLKHHPGQVSFPGGKYEQTDNTLAITALRETEEEIGIEQQHIELIGQLPALTTNTGYDVTPFIGFVKHTRDLQIDHGEVKACFEVPFSFILDRRNFSKQHLVANKQRHFTYCCAYQNHFIWGATAQMLINLQSHLR